MEMETLATKSKKTTQMRKRTIENLPPEVIEQILSRLPIDSVFMSRYVSKPWRSVINTRNMRLMHYNNSSQPQNHHSPTALILLCSHTHQHTLYYIPDFEACNIVCVHLTKLPFQPWIPTFTIVGSCNGFVCLADLTGNYRTVVICNPVSGDWIILPDPDHFGEIITVNIGFGYFATTNEYKVVRKRSDRKRRADAIEVITVGNNSWRTIEPNHFTSLLTRENPVSEALIDGCLHWLGVSQGNVAEIVSFDLENEEFGMVPVDPVVKSTNDMTITRLGMVEGCLSVLLTRYFHEVWVMSDYGKKESWVRRYIILMPLEHQSLRPLGIQKNGNILVECDDSALFSYDPITAKLEELAVVGLPTRFVAFPHVGTLVTLKNVISMEG